MTKKIGDVVLAITFLVFVIGAFSYFLNEADSVTGSSGHATSSLASLDSTLQANTSDMQQRFTDKTDNSSGLVLTVDSSSDNTGHESGGLLNILSKNILVSFVNLSIKALHIHPLIGWFIIALSTIAISIFTLRIFLSEGRI